MVHLLVAEAPAGECRETPYITGEPTVRVWRPNEVALSHRMLEALDALVRFSDWFIEVLL